MTTANHLETLLEAAITSGLCPTLRGWSSATGEVLPAQYLLLTRDLPRARARLRCAAEALLALLDVADGAYADGNGDHCAKFRALAAAPDWLLRPSEPDDNDPDVALVWECAVTHSGDWQGFLEALHQAGSVEWQWAIRRCRVLMRFEEEQGGDLAGLIGITAARPK
ncbi:MAG TPA: hypothetical protein ENN19_16075 [Chloroflexi bacterium]|nr:hypothetical protein [Chloroflexota bacterium]